MQGIHEILFAFGARSRPSLDFVIRRTIYAMLALGSPQCSIANWQRWLPACESDEISSCSSGRMLSMTFRPLHDRVLVRRIEAAEKSAGGIIIPDTAKEKPQEGEIVSVGTGVRAEDGTITPLDLKAGDKILFGKWSGSEIKVDGEDLIIMKEGDVLGVID
jgi:chaperonin GroES